MTLIFVNSPTRRHEIPLEPLFDLQRHNFFMEKLERSKPQKKRVFNFKDASEPPVKRAIIMEPPVSFSFQQEVIPPPPLDIPYEEPKPTDDYFVSQDEERKMFLHRFAVIERLYGKEKMGSGETLRETLPLDQLKFQYSMMAKRFDLDERIEIYMKGFVMFFMLMERFLNLDGLAQFHMENMNTYQRLLLKMSDEPMFKFLDNLSPGMILVGTISLQTFIFFVSKRWMSNPEGSQLLLDKIATLQLRAAEKMNPNV